MKKYILVIIVGLMLVVVGLLFFGKGNTSSTGKEYTIVLTGDGFQPNKLEIKRNDIVIFKTKNKKPFWPASDLHPTHEIYSDFDPKDAIMPEDKWSFKFGKVGEWKFHDHLAPYFRGVIIVKP